MYVDNVLGISHSVQVYKKFIRLRAKNTVAHASSKI